ncbi:MAG: hypothetical protein EOQ99_32465 [Mesorhizobium sp.]|nr:MAG: hypothetical protein EOQ56_13965 [Mesorhizobium sp.]RWO97103.1 MAG: hypothetical protein EOQ99_32465 [Mesorhizobium sp.]RWQ23483.1 MAG: hypothetical protein EOR92_05395 [Mesorhizobium sp.]
MRIERDGLPPLPDGASGPTHAFVILGRSRREAACADLRMTKAWLPSRVTQSVHPSGEGR